MTERVSRRPQICADRNRGTGQIVARLAQTTAALTTSRAKMRLLEVSNLPMSSRRARGFPKPPEWKYAKCSLAAGVQAVDPQNAAEDSWQSFYR
jgi:hypothetical protein